MESESTVQRYWKVNASREKKDGGIEVLLASIWEIGTEDLAIGNDEAVSVGFCNGNWVGIVDVMRRWIEEDKDIAVWIKNWDHRRNCGLMILVFIGYLNQFI